MLLSFSKLNNIFLGIYTQMVELWGKQMNEGHKSKTTVASWQREGDVMGRAHRALVLLMLFLYPGGEYTTLA